MFERLGKKIIGHLDEQSLGGDSSPGLAAFNAYFKRYSLSDVFPYGSYDEARGLFINRSTIGFVLEAVPLVGCTEAIQTQLSAIFQYLMPEGSNVQFLLYGDPFVGDVLERWVQPRQQRGGILEKISHTRRQFLSQFVFDGNAGVALRTFRCFLSFTIPFKEEDLSTEIFELKQRFLETLTSSGMPVSELRPEELMSFVDDLTGMPDQDFYPSRLSWDPNQDISAQIPSSGRSLQVKPDGLYLDEGRMVFRSYNVRRYPRVWAQSMMGELLGNQYHNLLRFPCPFLIHYGVHIPKQAPMKLSFLGKSNHVDRQAVSPLAKYLPDVLEEAEENQYVRNQLGANHRFVKSNFSVLTISPPEQRTRADQAVKNIFRTNGWDICEDRYLHLQGLITLLPMSWGDDLLVDLTSCKKLKTTLSTESANLLPIQGEWLGTQTPGVLLTGRRGQVFSFSPFDNNQGNYNVAVVGKSGSGKSVFMQDLLVSMVGLGYRVFVVDVGRSFENTCSLLGGQHIEFKTTHPICLNPFSSLTDEDPIDGLAMIGSLLCTMAAPTEGTTDHQTALIKEAVSNVWHEKKQQATITDVSNYLRSQQDREMVRLGDMLTPYGRLGLYGQFFEGDSNVNFNKNLVVLEMDELQSKRDLQEVITQMVIIHITNHIVLGDRKEKFVLIVDEASVTLDGKKGGPFIEALARRFRKCNASLITGTQSVNDYYNTPGALAAYENADWLCLLAQKTETISLLKENKRVTITPYMEDVLRSLHTEQGKYSEVMICGDYGFSVGRLLLDPISRILYSTKADEYVAVKTLVEEGACVEEAVTEVAMRKFPEEMKRINK